MKDWCANKLFTSRLSVDFSSSLCVCERKTSGLARAQLMLILIKQLITGTVKVIVWAAGWGPGIWGCSVHVCMFVWVYANTICVCEWRIPTHPRPSEQGGLQNKTINSSLKKNGKKLHAANESEGWCCYAVPWTSLTGEQRHFIKTGDAR